MSILTTDLIAYGSASLPTDDVSTTGGAIVLTKRPVFTQLAANSTVRLISDGTDVRVVTIVGRDATGANVSDAVTLTNATAVFSPKTYERILSVTAGATDGARTITVTNTGNTVTYGTIPPTETGFYALFQNSASATSISTRYEKFFWYNKNATLTLNAAVVKLTVDATATLALALAATNGDTATVANRVTTPGLSFVGVGVAQNVPTTTLPATTGVGVWISQTLAANAAPIKASFTTQLSGTTT